MWFPTLLSAILLLVGCETTTETVRKDPKNYPSREVKGYSREGSQNQTAESVGENDDGTASLPDNDATDVVYEDDLVRLEKLYVSGSSVGEPIDYKIIVTAKRAVINVEVDEFLPDSLKFQSSTPKASINQFGMPSWDLEAFKAGEKETILVTVIPSKEGLYEVCSVVRAEPLICLPLTVGMPELAITKSGPSYAELGDEVSWNVTVTNTGTATATDVVITDKLPAGFTATSPVSKKVGDLAPGQSSSMVVSAKSNQQGSFTNTAVATHARGGPQEATSPVNVVQSRVSITKTGPATGYIFVEEPYTITVTNTGNTELTDVVVTDILPDGAVLRGKVADGGEVYDVHGSSSGNEGGRFMPPVYDSNRNIYGYWKQGGNSIADDTADKIVWNVGNLAPGQSKTFHVSFHANKPMTTVNRAVVTARGPSGEPSRAEAKAPYTASEKPSAATAKAKTPVKSTAKKPAKGPATKSVKQAAAKTGEESSSGSASGTPYEKGQPEQSTDLSAGTGPVLKESASATTVWKAVPGLHTGISDSIDPIQIGQDTTYTIMALNQSGYDTFKVDVQKVFVGEGLKVKSVSAGGQVNGNVVTFGPVDLAPGKEVARTVTVTGEKPGSTTTRLETTTNFRKTAVEDQESTTVY